MGTGSGGGPGRATGQRRVDEVTVVVCAGFDPGLDAAVLGQISRLRAAGLRVAAPRHPPHLTLGAVCVSASELDEVRALIIGLAARLPPFDVRLDHLGAFAGGILWLGPQPCAELSGLQAAVDVELRDAGHPRAFGAQSDPQHWVAHCTLARRLSPDALGSAVAGLATGVRPLRGRVERLLAIRLRHPDPAESTPLGEGGTAARRGDPSPARDAATRLSGQALARAPARDRGNPETGSY